MDYQIKLLEVSRFKAWSVLIITSLFFFFEFGLTSVFNTIGLNISSEYSISMVHLGFINSLYFYTNILFLIPAGFVVDRFSAKTAIVCALFFCCSGIVLISYSESIYVLMGSRLIMGLAGSFCLIACIRVATNYFRTEKLGFAIGVVISIGMLGGYAAQQPLALLMDAYGWRHALFIVGMIGFVIMMLIFLFVRSAPKEVRQLRLEQRQSLKSDSFVSVFKQVLIKSQNWYAALYVGLINVATFMLGGAWANAYLVHVHQGVTQMQASAITGFLFLGMIVAYPFWGKFSEIIGKRKPPLILGAVASFIVVCLIMFVSGNLTWLAFLFFMLGFTTSAQTVAYPIISEINSMKVNATAVAMASMMSLFWGGVLAQPLFPALMNLYGKMYPNAEISGQYQFAIGILLVSFLISLVFAFLVKETYCKRQVD